MTGFNLPPGCNVSDLPGNSKAEQEAEALADAVYAMLFTTSGELSNSDEALAEKVLAFVQKIQGDAFSEGYAQGQSDEAQFRDLQEEDREILRRSE